MAMKIAIEFNGIQSWTSHHSTVPALGPTTAMLLSISSSPLFLELHLFLDLFGIIG